MSQPVIEVKNLSKVYRIGHERQGMKGTATFRDSLAGVIKKPAELLTGHRLKKEEFWALKDINFEVQQGDVVGIIGKNGSGKSTLLKILSQIVDPTRGEVRMRGRVASLLEVGTGFHPELTGRENIFFNGAILGMKRKEIIRKFDEIVAFSEVEQFLDTPVKFYSSGMYVRLAFAIAAHLDPDILIVDEVLAVGDAAFQKKSLGKMHDVASQGRTVLFVSHNLASVKTLCNRALLLSEGRIIKTGEVDEVASQYAALSAQAAGSLDKRKRGSDVSLEAIITKVQIIQGKPLAEKGSLDSTRPFTIKFAIDCKHKQVDNVIVHCGVTGPSQMVLRFMSEFTNQTYSLKRGENVIECNVQPSLLVGGDYSLDVAILHPGREQIGQIDAIQDALFFRVKELAVPSGKEFLTQREAVYYVEHSWS